MTKLRVGSVNAHQFKYRLELHTDFNLNSPKELFDTYGPTIRQLFLAVHQANWEIDEFNTSTIDFTELEEVIYTICVKLGTHATFDEKWYFEEILPQKIADINSNTQVSYVASEVRKRFEYVSW